MRLVVELDGGAGTADLVHHLRAAGRLTQRQLADRVGTKQPVISRWEHGGDEPRLSTLVRVAEACGFRLALVAEPDGVDRSQIRELRRLTPRQRLELLAADAIGLDELLTRAGR